MWEIVFDVKVPTIYFLIYLYILIYTYMILIFDKDTFTFLVYNNYGTPGDITFLPLESFGQYNT